MKRRPESATGEASGLEIEPQDPETCGGSKTSEWVPWAFDLPEEKHSRHTAGAVATKLEVAAAYATTTSLPYDLTPDR